MQCIIILYQNYTKGIYIIYIFINIEIYIGNEVAICTI